MKDSHGNADDNFNIACCICQKKFLLRNNLEKHLRNVHGQGEANKHICPTCGKQFYYKDDLKNHIQVHEGDLKFKCSELNCDKAYSTLKALRKHNKLTHQVDVDSVTCKICNKRLATKYKLKAHMLVHSDAKPFSCTHCSDTFKEKRNVIKHIKLKHIKANAKAAAKNATALAEAQKSAVKDSIPEMKTSDPPRLEELNKQSFDLVTESDNVENIKNSCKDSSENQPDSTDSTE